ncbi:MAG: bifunctional demethylmenaquinone methyltransferase/2-methoxy-6-polyprenyl-1,4-benzoquinol methylase UbiE [Firmicutes bacterium]|nr:bifunctional demethylmenaquinone methyltransferase/2-methoxy-6-polyprenyl-1,4-benzoquinol methylase UbiE [Bacillota bacterium]
MALPEEVYRDKEGYVRRMFASIAGRYDLMNNILSFRQDDRWRRLTAARSGLQRGGSAVDVCTGTGELARVLADAVGPGGKVVGLDFCREMLDVAEKKFSKPPYDGICSFVEGNALGLPFPDSSFDAATTGFALRNVTSVEQALAEMARVVRPGGRVLSLELSKPVWPLFKTVYYLYFYHLVPLLGTIGQGRMGPYRYLPNSLTRFPDQETLAGIMRRVGLRDVHYHNLCGGIVALHIGTKA